MLTKTQIKEEEERFEQMKNQLYFLKYDDVDDFGKTLAGLLKENNAHLSAQYEKLIEEVIGEDKPVVAGTDGWRTQKIINDEHSRIRTSLQERGIKIK